MKIGLLTYHWAPNFGAQMQTYASVLRLRAMGHEPVVINWRPMDSEQKFKARIPGEQWEVVQKFAGDFFDMTPLCRDENEVWQAVRDEKLDGVLVGSDSLFNLIPPRFSLRRLRKSRVFSDHAFPNPFWMPCGPEGNVPYAGLSISSQNSPYHAFAPQKDAIGAALRRFRYLSVRDEWTRQMVEYFTDGAVSPPVTPDPVFAMEQNRPPVASKAELCRRYGLPERYVLVSFFGEGQSSAPPAWVRHFSKLAGRRGLTCVEFPRAEGCQRLPLEHRIPLPLSPLDWYGLIRHASAYVGMLMHPIVVALHNAVPCYSFDNYGMLHGLRRRDERNSKIFLLLWDLGLAENRHSVFRRWTWPSPEAVMERLCAFDKEMVGKQMQERAEACMDNYRRAVASLMDSIQARQT